MINIEFKSKTMELKVTGHSGAEENGKDIVCAAISILFYTLAAVLNNSREMLQEEPVIKNESGNGYIKCKPKREYVGNVMCTYRTILTGMELMAEEYKNFINFSVKG